MSPILGIVASSRFTPQDFTVDFLVIAGGAGGSSSSAGGAGAGVIGLPLALQGVQAVLKVQSRFRLQQITR